MKSKSFKTRTSAKMVKYFFLQSAIMLSKLKWFLRRFGNSYSAYNGGHQKDLAHKLVVLLFYPSVIMLSYGRRNSVVGRKVEIFLDGKNRFVYGYLYTGLYSVILCKLCFMFHNIMSASSLKVNVIEVKVVMISSWVLRQMVVVPQTAVENHQRSTCASNMAYNGTLNLQMSFLFFFRFTLSAAL